LGGSRTQRGGNSLDYYNTTDMSAGCWTVRVPQFVRVEIERLARIERRKSSEMLRLVIVDALAQRGINVNSNTEEMKKADAA
jgi:hypothetical protein